MGCTEFDEPTTCGTGTVAREGAEGECEGEEAEEVDFAVLLRCSMDARTWKKSTTR
jgi:hypothetical protein